VKKLYLIIVALILYQVCIVVFRLQAYFPTVIQIIEAFIHNICGKEIYVHIASSLLRILVGFSIAGIVGISLGLFLAYEKRFTEMNVFIEMLRPIPPIAWIPISIIVFGLNNASAYFIVFLGAFFPIFTNTYYGALSIPPIYKHVASSFEIGTVRYVLKILLFYTLPYIFTGLKIGIGMAWMSVIAAELIGAQSGLGYYIQLNRLLLQTDNIIVGMILIGIAGNLLQKIIEFIEKKIIIWN
jgi:ABC-type nitrate/sulfonate/bicarbonate transport system permease component